jgi:hypothetical protein
VTPAHSIAVITRTPPCAEVLTPSFETAAEKSSFNLRPVVGSGRPMLVFRVTPLAKGEITLQGRGSRAFKIRNFCVRKESV